MPFLVNSFGRQIMPEVPTPTTPSARSQRNESVFCAFVKATAVFVVSSLALTGAAHAATERVLFDFSLARGWSPEDGVVLRGGHLFGTTTQGGPFGNGIVFELTRMENGWTEHILHAFKGPDGAIPVAGVTFDTAGNIYGTTSSDASGHGLVYKLTPSPGGWVESVLHTFTGGTDGEAPIARMIFDDAGNLYGTTLFGGAFGCGVVFKLTPTQEEDWTEIVLHSFSGCSVGFGHPQAGVVLKDGELYGATYDGGAYGFGTIFKLTPSENEWTETVLYTFTGGADGRAPSGVIFKAGRLWGTTFLGGIPSETQPNGNGVVFELAPSANDWTETVIYSFTGAADGSLPVASVTLDRKGNVYGTTVSGGVHGHGTVFKLSRSHGGWTETVLHSFDGGSDGDLLLSGLTLDRSQNLYGTTAAGGASGGGVVFRINSHSRERDGN
jgi:uncharacterized repeat protein (TIGR03803 family)